MHARGARCDASGGDGDVSAEEVARERENRARQSSAFRIGDEGGGLGGQKIWVCVMIAGPGQACGLSGLWRVFWADDMPGSTFGAVCVGR